MTKWKGFCTRKQFCWEGGTFLLCFVVILITHTVTSSSTLWREIYTGETVNWGRRESGESSWKLDSKVVDRDIYMYEKNIGMPSEWRQAFYGLKIYLRWLKFSNEWSGEIVTIISKNTSLKTMVKTW